MPRLLRSRAAVVGLATTAVVTLCSGVALAVWSTTSSTSISSPTDTLSAPSLGTVTGVTASGATINWSDPGSWQTGSSGATYTATATATNHTTQSCSALASALSCGLTGLDSGITYSVAVVGQLDLWVSGTSTTSVTTSASVVTPSTPAMLAADDSGKSNSDNITNVTKPHFTGTGGTSGNTISLFFDGSGTANGTGTVAADGTWSVAPTTALDGSTQNGKSHTVKAQESNGSTSSTLSSALTFTVDTTVPGAPANSSGKYTGSQYVDNTSPTADVVNAGNGTLTLTGETSLALEAVETAGSHVGSVFMSAYGTTATPSVTVDNATSAVSYKWAAVDVAGNVSSFTSAFAETDTR